MTTAAVKLSAEKSVQAAAIAGAKGDVNVDGVIDTRDVVSLQKYLLGKESRIYPDPADLDDDGTVDIFDMGLLKRDVIQRAEIPEPVYGPPEWFTTSATTTTMPMTQPLYGPPSLFTTTESSIWTEMPQTEYGPPNWFESTTLEVMTNTEPQDVYGPPNWFTDDPEESKTVTTETTMFTTPETTMETLYGPPNAWR